MKSKPGLILMFLAFAVFILSCQKGQHVNLPYVQVNGADNGKTINLAQGQTLKVDLGNPGDGGYKFDAPQYDPSVLSLKEHTSTPPANTNVIGDFGRDTWEFSTLKSGNTSLTVTATRSFEANSTVVIYTGKIAVN
jgi:predicted secreted protein